MQRQRLELHVRLGTRGRIHPLILIDIKIYNNIKKLYEIFEAIVDTGATFSVIAEHIAQEMGYQPQEKIHLWQVNSPLTLSKSTLKIKYQEREHHIEGVIVDIHKDYLRSATPNEKCKRPNTPHPLTSRIILGKTFLDKLTENERKQILAYLA